MPEFLIGATNGQNRVIIVNRTENLNFFSKMKKHYFFIFSLIWVMTFLV